MDGPHTPIPTQFLTVINSQASGNSRIRLCLHFFGRCVIFKWRGCDNASKMMIKHATASRFTFSPRIKLCVLTIRVVINIFFFVWGSEKEKFLNVAIDFRVIVLFIDVYGWYNPHDDERLLIFILKFFYVFYFSFQINLRLILVSGKTKEFLFSPSDSAGEIAKTVFEQWPEGESNSED